MKCGGIIGKVLDKDSEYIPGLKNYGWIKVNKSYYKAELDSLYLVIIGAKYGVGERARLYSMLCFACLNEKNDNYETLVMSNGGLKERQLDELLYYLKDHVIQYTPNNYKFGKYKPDVTFAPRVFVKVKTFFLCLNQFSAVGYEMIYENMGISMRFPRLFKLRTDIKKHNLTTSDDIIRLYNSQDFLKDKDEDKKEEKEEKEKEEKEEKEDKEERDTKSERSERSERSEKSEKKDKKDKKDKDKKDKDRDKDRDRDKDKKDKDKDRDKKDKDKDRDKKDKDKDRDKKDKDKKDKDKKDKDKKDKDKKDKKHKD
jgi:hypothetical protein